MTIIRFLISLMAIVFINGEAVSKTASLPQPHVVEIRAFSFSPERIVAAPGDTIIWINRDIVPHTVTENGGRWRSQALEEGQSWKVVIHKNGTYTYFCEFHPHMKGELATQS